MCECRCVRVWRAYVSEERLQESGYARERRTKNVPIFFVSHHEPHAPLAYGIVGIVDSRQRQHKSNSRLKNSILYSTPTRKKHVSVPSPKHSHFVHVVRDITCIICCCKIRTLQPNRCDSWCPSGNVFDESTNGPDEIVANVIRILKTQASEGVCARGIEQAVSCSNLSPPPSLSVSLSPSFPPPLSFISLTDRL